MRLLISFCASVLLSTGVFAHDAPLHVELIMETTVTTDTQTAYDVAWHPDGELLAVQGGAEVTIYDTDLQPVTPALAPTGSNLAWSPDGDQLATVEGFNSRRIRLWNWDADTNTVEEIDPIPITDFQYAVTWSPDGASLVTLNDDRGVRNIVTLWDIASRSSVWSLSLPYPLALRVLDWNGESIRGAGVNENDVLMLYEIDPATGDYTDLYPLPEGTTLFAFLPDDEMLATINNDGEVTLSAPDAEPITFQSIPQAVNIAWSPDGEQLAILGYERQLQIWQVSQSEN